MSRIKSNQSLSTIVANTADSLADLARWPGTKSRQEAAEHDIAVLTDALRGFDPIVPNAITVWLMFNMIDSIAVRDAPAEGIREAIIKFADVVTTIRG
jgi:hypothetical protein